MKWKNQIWIEDDIIPLAHQEIIKTTLLGTEERGSPFTWHFVPDVTGGESEDERPGFSHTFIKEGVINPDGQGIKELEPMWAACMEKVMEKTQVAGNYAAVNARTFLQMSLRNVDLDKVDAPHIDMIGEHFALLYYVCDSDGETILYENRYSDSNPDVPKPDALREKARVKSKQGRVVIFDGYYWHTATQPTDGVRCVINTNVVQHA